MSRGLFELRKDSITGWWVAVVVDRDFERERFLGRPTDQGETLEDCPNCRLAAGRRRFAADAEGRRVHRRRHGARGTRGTAGRSPGRSA